MCKCGHKHNNPAFDEPNPVSRIVISKCDTGYNATYSGPIASEVIELFGTATLPTGFTAAAVASDVLAKLRAANRDAVVLLATGLTVQS